MDNHLRDAKHLGAPSLYLRQQGSFERTRAWLAAAQRTFFSRVMCTDIAGASWIPARGGFLVVSNHASHLDAGLVKMALGSRGDRLHAMAAQDYFFSTPLRRWFFTHLTNVVPIERQGGFRAALREAVSITEAGCPLLIFPEGTRSLSGHMAPFKPAVSAMALTARVPILPLYLEGTHRAMPKGSLLWPTSRQLAARIGPPLDVASLDLLMARRARREGYRLVTEAVEMAVKSLRECAPLPAQVIVERVLARAPRPAMRRETAVQEALTSIA